MIWWQYQELKGCRDIKWDKCSMKDDDDDDDEDFTNENNLQWSSSQLP